MSIMYMMYILHTSTKCCNAMDLLAKISFRPPNGNNDLVFDVDKVLL